MRAFRIAVFPGDGIGREVMTPCLALLDAVVARVGGFSLQFELHQAGAEVYRATGCALPESALKAAESADAILLGAMGLPDVRYPNGTEIAPQLDFRERFELYAGIRPVRLLAGAPTPLADPRAREMDFVLVRESTEGLFAARKLTRRQDDAAVYDTMCITRRTSERLFTLAFELARQRRRLTRATRVARTSRASEPHERSGDRGVAASEGAGGSGGAKPPARVTCVDKANVLPAMAFFRSIFLECAAKYPDVEAECAYVDAVALRLVRAPWDFDVLVTENMFGDILSDLGAALIGGMGMAPSADIGDQHALFQPCHGSAPDIAGKGLANPTAMLLSAAMMLTWLGDRHDVPACRTAATELTRAVEHAYANGTLVPVEYGGTAGTNAIVERVRQALDGPVRAEFIA